MYENAYIQMVEVDISRRFGRLNMLKRQDKAINQSVENQSALC